MSKLTPEQVEEYTEALRRHYNEPVMPVSHYCNAFRAWGRALVDRKTRVQEMSDDDPYKPLELADTLTELADLAFRLDLSISKSNLLSRLIYGGQPLRTEMCPVHKGRWSGCVWDTYCECMDGDNVTGWLPNHPLHTYELIERWLKANRRPPASWARHFPASPDYNEDEPCTASAMGYRARGKTTAEAAERLAVQLAAEGFVAEEWQP